MYQPESTKFLGREDFEDAFVTMSQSALAVKRTPMILAADTSIEGQAKRRDLFAGVTGCVLNPTPPGMKLYLKLESAQNRGSFKIRGIVNQLEAAKKFMNTQGRTSMRLVTSSAGNYGRAFAYAASSLGLPGVIVMPETAPGNRARIIQAFPGMTVDRVPNRILEETVAKMHSYDDLSLMSGYGTLAQEILEDVPDVDVVVLGCGGGGVLAGVSAAMKTLSDRGDEISIYGVEPETANTMYLSFQQGSAASVPNARSVASGLSPPSAGRNAFRHVRRHCRGVVLVSDRELRVATRVAHEHAGIVTEAAGAAGLAALLSGKLQKEIDLAGKTVVAIVTGGNITPEELVDIFDKTTEDVV